MDFGYGVERIGYDFFGLFLVVSEPPLWPLRYGGYLKSNIFPPTIIA